ncbi:MAG: DUF1573 domain-containing protein [Planctomycetota bacterium]|jgi:hypothetical protein
MTFEKLAHDFGPVTDTRKHTVSFRFTNTGTEKLVISNITASCGCTVPTLRRRQFLPGESDTVDVTFTPLGKPGITDKQISLVTNAKRDPVVKLGIRALVEPMLRFERFHRLGGIRLGQEHKSVIHLSFDDPDLVIRNMSVEGPHVTARLVEMGVAGPTVRGKTTYEGAIEVTISKEAPWGVIYATHVQLTVYGRPEPQDDPIEFDYRVYISGHIHGELRAQPKSLGFGRLGPNQSYEKKVTLSRSSGAPFTVTAVRISETTIPGAEVRVEPVSDAQHRIVVHGSTGNFRGGFKGVVTVNTDVPGEESLNIRFAGYVK